MRKSLLFFILVFPLVSFGQEPDIPNEKSLIQQTLRDPAMKEISRVSRYLRKTNISPQKVIFHDTLNLSNGNNLYVLSHLVNKKKHFGAVVIPGKSVHKKLPVMILATGGDGIHKQFDISQDFNHKAVQFPQFLGHPLDDEFIVVIPSFRGQQLSIGQEKYQSDGKVSDAFDGATTDALAFLNVVLKTFELADEKRIGIFGGSRGGTVALLAASRDSRIKRVIAVAAPTNMKALYSLYPEQFKLLFFDELLAGQISEKEARRKFISSSPNYFIDLLPKVQLHHDRNDPFVPVKFARELAGEMINQARAVEVHYYNEGVHGFWSDYKFWKRVQNFMKALKND